MDRKRRGATHDVQDHIQSRAGGSRRRSDLGTLTKFASGLDRARQHVSPAARKLPAWAVVPVPVTPGTTVDGSILNVALHLKR
jgi:hypothetical protein